MQIDFSKIINAKLKQMADEKVRLDNPLNLQSQRL